MINLQTIVKIVRGHGHSLDWPEASKRLIQRLQEIKKGFPGIRNDHLSFIEITQAKEGDLIIIDKYLETSWSSNNEPPLMLRVLPGLKGYVVEGIGIGEDKDDPYRVKMRWKDIIPELPYNIQGLVLRVDVKPTLNGGPGYYYFFKSYRDFRY